MTSLPLALSLSNSLTQIGAIAAFAALVGIAVLSLAGLGRQDFLDLPHRPCKLLPRVRCNVAQHLFHLLAGPFVERLKSGKAFAGQR